MTFLLLCLGIATGTAQSEGLTVSKLSFDKGSAQWVVDLKLKSGDKKVVAYQCDLAFPAAVEYANYQVVQKNTVSKPVTHLEAIVPQVDKGAQANGALRLVISSLDLRSLSDHQYLQLYFSEKGTLEHRKSYGVNLTNIELVYRAPGQQFKTLRQQGIINDAALPSFDALCNAASAQGDVPSEEVQWMKRCLAHNASLTSVDFSRCQNAELGEIPVGNPNALVYVHHDGQVSNRLNLVSGGVCKHLSLSVPHPYAALQPFTAQQIDLQGVVSDSGYETLVLPFSCDVPLGVKAYQLERLNAEGDWVIGQPMTGIAAHQPFLLKGVPGDYAFEGTRQRITKAPQRMENGLLVGAYLPAVAQPGDYVLQVIGEEAAFCRLSQEVGMSPFQAFLKTDQTEFPQLRLSLGEITGLELQTGDQQAVESIYNLGGQRLLKKEKGVLILRAKDATVRKVMVK